MRSSFAWVDIDEKARRRMLDVIDLFRDQDIVDELGLGTIRDAFADYFFPGTSTIQTRARYFLFIPWIYQQIERKRTASAEAAAEARNIEVKLIFELLKAHPEENEGVIGRLAKERLQRLPSNIYWVGLSAWRIRHYPGTQDQYHRYLTTYYRFPGSRLVTDEREPVDGHPDHNWDPHLPKSPQRFPLGADFNLTHEEARYLKDRIISSNSGSLLAACVNAPELFETEHLWDNPLVATVPDALKREIGYARDFALIAQGATVLYNLLLARKSENQSLVDDFTGRLKKWANEVKKEWETLHFWYSHLKECWESESLIRANIPFRTKEFVTNWCRLVLELPDPEAVGAHAGAHKLIQGREARLKGLRARLGNERYLKMWNGGNTDIMTFRWNKALRIVGDIRERLKAGGAGNA